MSLSTRPLAHTAGRAALAGVAALTAAVALAGPAFAHAGHAEVEADVPQALATDVTLTFVFGAESASAGLTQLRILLPEGITPGDVRLSDAPKDWKLKTTNDGYTVGGSALEAGVDTEHMIVVKQLPNAKELAFKTVETYSDGKTSRWFELPTGGKEPEQPAPVLKLKAAAPGAASPTPSPSEGEAPAPSASATDKDEGTSTGLVVGGATAALVLGGGAWWLVKRRSTTGES
ncbi:DUF1775 domain-containing protein [Streptomyces sp. S1D4-11]